MKIKNRFDRVLKMLTVFAMTLSCFTDMPIRVVAESFDVDSVISIESHNNGTDANDSEASLAVSVTVNGQTVTAPKSVAPGTLTVRANEGYEIDSMILDGMEFNESTDVQAGEHSLNITAHSTASQSNESEEIQQPDPTVEPTPTITPDPTPEVSEDPKETNTPEVTETPDADPTETPEVTEKPTDKTFELTIEHYLTYEGVQYSDQTNLNELNSESFIEGKYDYSSSIIEKEGLNVISQEMVINQDAFEEGKATVSIEYAIAEGYGIFKEDNAIETYALIDSTPISLLNIAPLNSTVNEDKLTVEIVDTEGNSLGKETITLPSSWTPLKALEPDNKTITYNQGQYKYVETTNEGYTGGYDYIRYKKKESQ